MYQAKYGLHKSSFGQCNLQYFTNLFSIEQSEESVLDNKLFIDTNHIKNLQENLKAWFKDLVSMKISVWIISSFDVEVESTNLDTFLKEESVEMTFDLDTKSIYMLGVTEWTK